MSVNQLFAPIFVAGFYYKTFMWPAKFWEAIYEPADPPRRRPRARRRRMPIPTTTTRRGRIATCWSPAAARPGLSAALAAGRAGARVILCEEDFALGGRLLSDGGTIDGMPAAEWIARTLAELAALPDVRIMRRTTLFGVYDGGTYGALERVNDHVPVAARASGAPAAVADRRQALRRRGRRHRAADRVRRQRHARA